ncbi:hypothetical protein FFLO_05745 [Filobasidium floriforme]|uniref:Uncharacterized protein n=1 Tax=Filobasidium floriforme TaxID=5210 RepID=A0A8K0JII1_9TREE|nr:hypothetical protein FFLO_05745 [Filobasidium floriforme]
MRDVRPEDGSSSKVDIDLVQRIRSGSSSLRARPSRGAADEDLPIDLDIDSLYRYSYYPHNPIELRPCHLIAHSTDLLANASRKNPPPLDPPHPLQTAHRPRPPLAAKTKSDAQPRWPVHLNHCFGRIILDNICQRPWREVLQPPAVRNMSVAQLGKAVEIGEGILGGTVDLEKLNQESLQMRAKSRSMPGIKGQVNKTMGHAVHAGPQSHSASPTTTISSPNLITAPGLIIDPAELRDLPPEANSTSESRPKNKKKKTIRDYFKSPVEVEVE